MPHISLESMISRLLSALLSATFFGIFVAARGSLTLTFSETFMTLLFFVLTYEILAAIFKRLFVFFENRRVRTMRQDADTITVQAKEMK